jgi:hypothetical protein
MKGPNSDPSSASRGIRKLLKDALTPSGLFTIVPGLANIGSTWQAFMHAWYLHAAMMELLSITVGLAGAAYVAWQIVTAVHRSSGYAFPVSVATTVIADRGLASDGGAKNQMNRRDQ